MAEVGSLSIHVDDAALDSDPEEVNECSSLIQSTSTVPDENQISKSITAGPRSTAPDEIQTLKSVTAGPVVDEAKKVQDKLQKFNEMRILLVGKSGVGKSSFINCLFGRDVASIGVVKPETTEVQPYSLKLENEGVTIKIYDTPGFGTNKKDNQKIIKEIQRVCELVDVIFLCFKIDDQFRAEDELTVTLLADKFKQKFWEKTLIILTRANMATRMGIHKKKSKARYLKEMRDDLKEIITGALKKAKVASIPPFLISGYPSDSPSRRMIPCIDDSPCISISDESPQEIDWLPAVMVELFKSGCSENGKAVLLKSGLGKWAQTGVYAGASTGTTVAALTGVGIVVVGVILLPVAAAGIPVIAAGSAIIGISLAVGGSSVAGFGAAVENHKSSNEKRIKKVMSEVMKKSDTGQ